MAKQYVFTSGPAGTSVVSVASKDMAVKLCILAVSAGCFYAFYAE